MRIGIPRAFLYHIYAPLWETFFNELGFKIILSEETNKKILSEGLKQAIDENCLSFKIYLGHIYSLKGKCDYIFIPRIGSLGDKELVCSKFQATYDVVSHIFRDDNMKFLQLNIDVNKKETEFKAFMKLGKELKKHKIEILRAYFMAKYAEKIYYKNEIKKREEMLNKKDQLKILIVAHPYIIYDKLVGEPILEYLKQLNCLPIVGDIAPKQLSKEKAKVMSPTLHWTFSKELVGALALYKKRVEGIILITAFPCGPDSLVNEMIVRKIQDKPILKLILDEQEGRAGIETRLESFIDIIKIKKDKEYEKDS